MPFSRDAPRERAQRVERVVRDHALPDQVPERVDDLGGETAHGRLDLMEERCAVRAEVRRRSRLAPCRPAVRGHVQQRQVIREIDRDPPVLLAQWLDAHPDDLARRAERVEIGRLVVGDARGEDLALEDRRRHREALQRLDHFQQRVETAALAASRPASS